MGIGLKHLWHGRPDARAIGWFDEGVNVVIEAEHQYLNSDEIDEVGDAIEGWKTDTHEPNLPLDGKRMISPENLSQLVAAAGVSS